jgi:hypothetical protein
MSFGSTVDQGGHTARALALAGQRGGYGAAEDEVIDAAPVEPAAPGGGRGGRGKGGEAPEDLVAQYLPTVKTIVDELTDASRQSEVLAAQIANTRELIRRMPWAAGALRLRLRKLQARKRAADRRLAIQREGESSVRTWRALGQVALLAGIGLMTAAAVRVVR